MTGKLFMLFLISFVVLISCTKSNKVIIDKTISRLNSINSIEYQVITRYLQKDMGMNKIDTALCYFDFTGNDTLIGAKYQFLFNQGVQVYNGKQAFTLDENKERIIYTNEPQTYDASGSIFMMNSVWMIKKLLPEFINDSTVSFSRQKDTIIHGEDNYAFNIIIKGRYINIGALLTESKGTSANYNLYISKKTYLPTEFINVFSEDKGFWSSSFSKYVMQSSRPDTVWSIDKLPQRYLRISTKELGESFRKMASVQIGQKATDWKLPLLGSNDSIQLTKLKGNLILLEFWFPYCVGCVKAIPDINNIQKVYAKKGIKVYGVEFGQSNDKGLDEYIKKQKIEYPTLHTGKNMASDYGVNAAPTFFLIDKNGVIRYSSVGLNISELTKTIDDNI